MWVQPSQLRRRCSQYLTVWYAGCGLFGLRRTTRDELIHAGRRRAPANARWGKRAEGATPATFASKVGKWVGQVIGPSLAPLPPRSRRAPPMEPRSGWTDPRAAGDASERMNLEEER